MSVVFNRAQVNMECNCIRGYRSPSVRLQVFHYSSRVRTLAPNASVIKHKHSVLLN